MALKWVQEELRGLNLNDKRLNRCMEETLSLLAEHSTASIPSACGGYAETTAAYRLFDNEKVTFDKVLKPHVAATRQRIVEQGTVVLVQDTTEIDLTRPKEQVVGAGRLADESRQGAFLHLLTAFTPAGTCLGTVGATVWTRTTAAPSKDERQSRKKHKPIEEKESGRWVATFMQAVDVAKEAPQTRCVTVADSEADIYELFVTARTQSQSLQWIVRACQNRAIDCKNTEIDQVAEETRKIREYVSARPVLYRRTIQVRGRETKYSKSCPKAGRKQPRKSRTAEVEVRSAKMTLRPPHRPGHKLPPIEINVVMVSEPNPPADDEPVEWILLTSLEVEAEKEVREVVDYYCVRWMIEVFFRTLKSGCRVEERRFERLDRLLPCLAVYLIVTWRTLYVCRLAREIPDAPCSVVFEPAEWKAVCQVVRREPPPSNPPPLSEIVRLIAQLGGYVNKPRPDPPGPQTVWLGMQRVHDFALCRLSFGPEAAKAAKDV